MFDRWRERRQLPRKISVLEKKTAGWDWRAEDWFGKDSELAQEQKKLRNELYPLKERLDSIETKRLTSKAQRLGIDLPAKPQWWWDDSEALGPEDANYYLTDIGKAGVTKLIRDERRKNIEWQVKTITPIIGALISLLGLIVALVTISKK